MATLEALSLGANDYVTKPANVGSVTESGGAAGAGPDSQNQNPLPPSGTSARGESSALAPSQRLPVVPVLPARAGPIEIVCLGTSTGGPNALAEVFAYLPENFPVPIVIVQHMPPLFTAMLAERLTAHSPVPCHEGREGQVVECGHAYIAPGG